MELESEFLTVLLDAVGAHPESEGVQASVVVVGGAALSLRAG